MRTSLPFAAARLAALCLPLALATLPADAQQSRRVIGTFTEVGADTVTVKPETGDPVTIRLAPDATVARLSKGTTADLKPGVFVGVGARPQPDGTQKAVQIVIFPESMRGTGEGHRAWGVLPETTMTNAAIADIVQSVDGPNFTLNYKDGSQKVSTPADASILKLSIVQRSDLKPGTRGQIVATRDANGTHNASRVTLWADDVTPY